VDAEFERLLVAIFGEDFIDVFKAKRPAGWIDLMMAFESRKRVANPFKNKPLNVSLPFSFIDYHKKYRVPGRFRNLFIYSNHRYIIVISSSITINIFNVS